MAAGRHVPSHGAMSLDVRLSSVQRKKHSDARARTVLREGGVSALHRA